MRIAFYPCCAKDFEMPTRLLSGHVDHIIFCDPDPTIPSPKNLRQGAATVQLIRAPAQDALRSIPRISVLFYRRDNLEGEGGSGLFVFGDVFLRPLMDNFCINGGMFITDGSNSRGGNFKKMIRASGLQKFNRHFSASPKQPFLVEYGLWCIDVSAYQMKSEKE